MPKQGNEYLLDAEELKVLFAAEELLAKMKESNPVAWRAWKSIGEVLRPQQFEDEVEFARRIA